MKKTFLHLYQGKNIFGKRNKFGPNRTSMISTQNYPRYVRMTFGEYSIYNVDFTRTLVQDVQFLLLWSVSN